MECQPSARDVCELRKRTACPLMECRHALIQTEGDLDQAVAWLMKRRPIVPKLINERHLPEGDQHVGP